MPAVDGAHCVDVPPCVCVLRNIVYVFELTTYVPAAGNRGPSGRKPGQRPPQRALAADTEVTRLQRQLQDAQSALNNALDNALAGNAARERPFEPHPALPPPPAPLRPAMQASPDRQSLQRVFEWELEYGNSMSAVRHGTHAWWTARNDLWVSLEAEQLAMGSGRERRRRQ
jgi:hypothetical protein